MYPTRQQLINSALQCHELGIIPIPTNGKKRAVAKWKRYDETPPALSETLKTFRYSFTEGIAVLCGPRSGNLEVIDIDTKNELEGYLAMRYFVTIKQLNPELLDKLVIQKTRSGGYHLLYRCLSTDRSKPLARRYATPEEILQNPDLKIKVLIETRGKKGMACIAPTNGYRFLRGSLSTINLITDEERALLFRVAASFNQVEEKKKEYQNHYVPRVPTSDPSFSPIDDFNRRADIIPLLLKHGWRIVDDTDPDVTHFLRPGDTDKDSSGNYNRKLNLFSTFSTSTIFIANKGYSPAGVFIQLECNGDDKEGVKELLRRGYGVPYYKQRSTKQAAYKK